MRRSLCIALMVLAGAWAADLAWFQPKELVGQLAGHRATVVVLQVGPNVIVPQQAHSGAIYAGPANRPEGLELLKAEAAKLPHDREIGALLRMLPMGPLPQYPPGPGVDAADGLYARPGAVCPDKLQGGLD